MSASTPHTAPQLDWISLGGNFLLVLLLLVAVLWGLRRLQGMKGLQGLRPIQRRLTVVEALSVGPRQKLAIVRMDDREMLVGITANGFTLLEPGRCGSVCAAAAAAAPQAVQPREDTP